MIKKIAKLSFIILLLVFLVFLMERASALEAANSSIEDKALKCLNQSNEFIKEMTLFNLSIRRVNESYTQALSLYDAQLVLKKDKKNYDFSTVIPYCDQIKSLHDDSLEAKDQLDALLKFYSTSLNDDFNTTTVDKVINEIRLEMESERYERVKPLIDQAYQEIIDVQSSQTTVKLFYDSTTRSIKRFFYENWKVISLVSGFVIFMLFFYKVKISKMIAQRKINKLEMRKKTIKELIMKTQKDYFEKGALSEGTYSIRTKKLGELVLDIERQIPLLQEELARLGRNDKNK